MWESLPPIVLSLIYDNMDMKTKLLASATCKHWRNALFSPRAIIHEKLSLKFLCRPPKRGQSDVERDRSKRFLKHANCLVLDWCNCQKDMVIDVLSSDESCIKNYTIQRVHFHSKGSFFGCEYKPLIKGCANKCINQTIVAFIGACKNIKSIDFGSCDLCRQTDILNVVGAKSKHGQLTHVNLSCFGIGTVLSKEGVISLIKDNLLKNLKEIYIDWDENFEDLISLLTYTSTQIKVLGLLVQKWNICQAKVYETNITNLWQHLKSQKPAMKVKLNLTEIFKGDIRTVLDKEMPLTSLCVVYKSDEDAEIVLDNLRNTSLGSNLKEIGFHHIECIRSSIFFSRTTRNSNISLFTHLDCLTNLENLSWSGQFVLDTDLLSFVTQRAVSLKELAIHKQEVVCESQATREYYIPLSSAKVHGLEKTISATLKRSWKMLKEPPVQRLSRRNLDFEEESFWVLQNKGF